MLIVTAAFLGFKGNKFSVLICLTWYLLFYQVYAVDASEIALQVCFYLNSMELFIVCVYFCHTYLHIDIRCKYKVTNTYVPSAYLPYSILELRILYLCTNHKSSYVNDVSIIVLFLWKLNQANEVVKANNLSDKVIVLHGRVEVHFYKQNKLPLFTWILILFSFPSVFLVSALVIS